MVKHANQLRYKKRQKGRRGMAQVAVWVPEHERDNLLEIAEQMREGFSPTSTGEDNEPSKSEENQRQERKKEPANPGIPTRRRTIKPRRV